MLDQLITYAVRQSKPITIVDCPNLKLLRKLDKLVVMHNNLVDN